MTAWPTSAPHTSRPVRPSSCSSTDTTYTAALIPIRTQVAAPALRGMAPPAAVRGWRTDFAPLVMHSGHWKPTEASRMHSGQIGRSHRWHEM